MNKTSLVALLGGALVFASPVLAQHGDHGRPQRGTTMKHGGDHAAMTHKMGVSGMSALKRLSGRDFDVAFLSQMIAHHQGALDMSRDALPNLKNAQVKGEAQKIIRDQSKEIRTMTALLRDTYKVKPSTAQMKMMKADMQSMMAMPMSNDRTFLQMMIPHHEGAVEMSQLALKQSNNAALKNLAQNIINEQRREIASYRNFLATGKLVAPARMGSAAASRQVAATYQCPACKMTFSAADAKKMNYQCPMKDGKLVAVKGR